MSRTVQVRIDKYLEGDSLERGAVVEIRAIEPKGGRRRVDRLVVPVGTDSNMTRGIDLEPGRYEFAAYLPSGTVTSRVIDVSDGPTPEKVVLEGGDSPHEWMSWQHMYGNVAGRESAETLRSSFARSAPPVQDSYAGFQVSLWLVPVRAPGTVDPIWSRLSEWLRALEPGQPANPGKIVKIVPAGATVKPIALQRDPPYAAVRLEREAGTDSHRAYLVVDDSHGRSMICAMPYPWRQMTGEEALVEAVIAIDEETLDDARDDDRLAWSVRPGVRDRQLGGVLGYLGSGDAAAARELLGPAREMLFGKMMNPMSAAAGGYLLVHEWVSQSAADTTRTPEWVQWIDNLANWFPWLPDGAILQGWLALRRRGRDPDLAGARAALLEAEKRGIPIFTAGIRRLSDGLLILASEAKRRKIPDAELDAALARVRCLAWQSDPRQVFTCVRLWSA
jgi:hypothetical protein